MTARLAIIVSGFPRRSETFALHELSALAARGMLGAVYATKPGEPDVRQPGVASLLPIVSYIPDLPVQAQAAWVASRASRLGLHGIHAYFAHRPAEVAQVASRIARLPFGFSVHARDARKVTAAVLAERARAAACVVACNPDVRTALPAASGVVQLIPHGVDLARFRPSPPPTGRPVRLLAVGRLVRKKGFDVLLDALAALRQACTLRIVGEGPERPRLESMVSALQLGDRVTLVGARTHVELPCEYSAADAVVVPSVVDADGDRDGLPNVVLEAMASGRPVVATRVGAIASAVAHESTGLLVDHPTPSALAQALSALASDPARRLAMGASARRVVEREYELGACAAQFVCALEAAYA